MRAWEEHLDRGQREAKSGRHSDPEQELFLGLPCWMILQPPAQAPLLMTELKCLKLEKIGYLSESGNQLTGVAPPKC